MMLDNIQKKKKKINRMALSKPFVIYFKNYSLLENSVSIECCSQHYTLQGLLSLRLGRTLYS